MRTANIGRSSEKIVSLQTFRSMLSSVWVLSVYLWHIIEFSWTVSYGKPSCRHSPLPDAYAMWRYALSSCFFLLKSTSWNVFIESAEGEHRKRKRKVPASPFGVIFPTRIRTHQLHFPLPLLNVSEKKNKGMSEPLEMLKTLSVGRFRSTLSYLKALRWP